MSVRSALFGSLLLLAACAEGGTSPVAPAREAALATPLSSTAQIVDGRVGPGALYRFARPENWNGTLLLYAHGYVAPDQPVALPAEGELLIGLLAEQGVAVAYSSFSENGWAVKDGTQRTHQLLGLFTSEFGRPLRTYVGGASLGGLIAIKLTETYPLAYDGTLASCAVAGGLQSLLDYQAHVRALFDFFYPGVLPGDASFLPAGTDVATGIVGPALAAMAADPGPALTLARIDQAPVPGTDPGQIIESIATALAGHAASVAELQSLSNGKPYFDNQDTDYSGALLPPLLLQAVNAGIDRFAAFPSALQALRHDYEPSGDLATPMLMLSNAVDPVVPGFNQTSYRSAVLANGAGDLLVQREVPAAGHCVFTPEELSAAFTDLVLWSEFGIVPVP